MENGVPKCQEEITVVPFPPPLFPFIPLPLLSLVFLPGVGVFSEAIVTVNDFSLLAIITFVPGDCRPLSGLWQALTAISSFLLRTNFLRGRKHFFVPLLSLCPSFSPSLHLASHLQDLCHRKSPHWGGWWRNPEEGVGCLDATRRGSISWEEAPRLLLFMPCLDHLCIAADTPAVTGKRRDHCGYFMKSVRGSFSVAEAESGAFTALSLIFSFFPPSSFYIIQSKSDILWRRAQSFFFFLFLSCFFSFFFKGGKEWEPPGTFPFSILRFYSLGKRSFCISFFKRV